MAVSLEKFNVPGTTEAVLVQPKLAYRFRVKLNGFGAASESDSNVLELFNQVVSVSRPSLTHDDVVVDVYNSRIFLAGKHTWDPITLTVRDDVTGNVAKAIARQLQSQLDHANQSGKKAGANYKFTMAIENLDGTSEGNVLDKWELGGCYIQNVNYGENNYATSDPLQITLQIKYDNANHTVDGSPMLSEAVSGLDSSDNANSGTSEESGI
jgi:hypothetical protein